MLQHSTIRCNNAPAASTRPPSSGPPYAVSAAALAPRRQPGFLQAFARGMPLQAQALQNHALTHGGRLVTHEVRASVPRSATGSGRGFRSVHTKAALPLRCRCRCAASAVAVGMRPCLDRASGLKIESRVDLGVMAQLAHEPLNRLCIRACVCDGLSNDRREAEIIRTLLCFGDWGSPAATSAPGLGSPAATSAPGLGSPAPRLHRDWGSRLPRNRPSAVFSRWAGQAK